MKAIVTGATGQDGYYLSKQLLQNGYEVHGLVRKSASGNLKNIKNFIQNRNFQIQHGDLLDLHSIIDIIKKINPQEIYNFADQDHVGWSLKIPSYSFNVTATSVINLLEIIKKYSPKSKFFQPLSSNIFGPP